MEQRFINLTDEVYLTRSDNKSGNRSVLSLRVPSLDTPEGQGLTPLTWSLTERTLSLTSTTYEDAPFVIKDLFDGEDALWVLCDKLKLYKGRSISMYAIPFGEKVLFCLTRGVVQLEVEGEWIDFAVRSSLPEEMFSVEPVEVTWDTLPNLPWNNSNPMIADGLYHFSYVYKGNTGRVSPMSCMMSTSTPIRNKWLEEKATMAHELQVAQRLISSLVKGRVAYARG